MLVHAGSPKALDVHGFNFDSVDRCFAAMAAAGFVAFIAVVVWAWLSWASPHAKPARVLGVHGFSGKMVSVEKPLEEERLSYLRSLQRHPAAMEYGEVRNVVALKRGVGDHTPERFADYEPRRNTNHGGFSALGPGEMDWKAVKRLNALT